MDSQAPPSHYPNSHESTAVVYRTRDDRYSPPVSPRYQLPAYGDEGAPPEYETEEDLEKLKAHRKKTLIIRVMTSIFVATLVSLIVAAAIARIQQGKTVPQDDQGPQA